MILKKKILQALVRRKKNTCSAKGTLKKKNSCTAVRKKKKMLQSYFIIQIALKNPREPATIFPLLPLNSGFGDAAELLLYISNGLQSIHQKISVVFR